MAGSRRRAMLDVSVVIVNYNVRDFLHQALVSIQKSLKGIKSEIIVVDNASDDGSVEMLHRQFPRVQVISNPGNIGFAKANNQALKQTSGKYILCINPDTVVQEDTIRVMVGYLEDHPEVGMAGCKILNPDGTIELACRRSFPTPWIALTKIVGLSKIFPKTKLFGKYNLTYLNIDETYPVEAVSGSFMMIRKKAIDVVGGLDESFFMYGEDLDWCYRTRKAGWNIAYVHSTQIIHYKGESTRRSSIDERYMFYNAMQLFVKKHFHSSVVYLFLLRCSISIVSLIAFLGSLLKPLRVAVLDFIAVTISLLLSEKIWRGELFRYPAYAYSIVFTIPAFIVIICLYASGVYTQRRLSVSRSLTATFIAYIIISTLIAYFKEYAFSRMIVIISGILAIIFISGWRLVIRLLGKAKPHGRGTLFGMRTVIVGTDNRALALYKKLRSKVGEGYEIVGFVGSTHKHIGQTIQGMKVLGSIENVGKIIKDQRISDVIFAPQALSYSQILSVIGKSREYPVAFHLVPTTMEVIVGKASVDNLENLPLVQIAYNIDKPLHRFSKRIFDIIGSSILLVTCYPLYRLSLVVKQQGINADGFFEGVPLVWKGSKSFVGYTLKSDSDENKKNNSLFLGKPGLCGLVQLQEKGNLTSEEISQYDLYYARNQSILLDLEIMMKTWLRYRTLQKRMK